VASLQATRLRWVIDHNWLEIVVPARDTEDMSRGENEPDVTIDADGHRTVRWSATDSQGKTFIYEHGLPDALGHHYRPAAMGEDVLLYDGPFRRDHDPDPFEGSVRWRWADRPRIEARGSRPTSPASLQRFIDSTTNAAMWLTPDELDIHLIDGTVPPQPSFENQRERVGQTIVTRLEQQLGDGTDLHCVTFLIPNGWQSHDGLNVCDPENLLRHWPGRVSANGGGWSLTIDPTGDTDWRALKDTGSYCFTHVGKLTRADGSRFSGEEAFQALDRVRVALNLALGRRTTCALPVGWRDDAPVWARWRSAPVDPYRTVRHWLDETIAARQVGLIIQRVLDFSADAASWEVLRPAVAYYVAANMDVDVELSVSVPISALQLLAYYRFVSDRGSYSNNKWHQLDTETQLRLLLDDIHVELEVHPHFEHLVAAQRGLTQNATPRDALGVVIKMRNIVTHPSKHKPAAFSPYEWFEAGMHARYWLCLSLLNLVGYDDEVAAVMGSQPQWVGQLRHLPWASTPGTAAKL
jgi:hypothetical protein